MSKNFPDTSFFSGEIIGNCVLQKLLGVRENREVWLVFDKKLQRHAAMKFIRDSHRKTAVLQELADFLKNTDCRQLVKVLNTSVRNGWFIAELEYASGGSLLSWLRKHRRMTQEQSVFVMREVLTALEELHRNGIVHRDIKPGNIWIASGGEIRIGDLGIARMEKFPEDGPAVFGTPSAMSPEQTFDTTKTDSRTDFFSLSSLIFELLTGHPRFPRGGLVETARLIRSARPETMMRELRNCARPDFIRLLGWMAAQNRVERPADAKTIQEELLRLKLPCEPLVTAENGGNKEFSAAMPDRKDPAESAPSQAF